MEYINRARARMQLEIAASVRAASFQSRDYITWRREVKQGA
jgi:hypothetical protein